jgi:hypothetical protein
MAHSAEWGKDNKSFDLCEAGTRCLASLASTFEGGP